MSELWQPIKDYEIDPRELADGELRGFSNVWIEQSAQVMNSDDDNKEFIERLKREWAVETGLIERLYNLDRGVTELMIEQGIKATLIPHKSENNPAQTVSMINDQKDAIDGIFQFVSGERGLSTGYIKELHSVFTKHQDTTEAIDQFGRCVEVPLIRGDYKKQSNNPTRNDGTVYEYCPPEQVAVEMDRLMEMHHGHKNVAPEVEAAWLHHRFTQIHPFQDGNGRVARALATLVFIKAEWLPLVVRDDRRTEYIAALEAADEGDLAPLIAFFSSIQKREFIRAIGLVRDVKQSIQVSARIKSIQEKLAQRRDSLEEEMESAKSKAEKLHQLTRGRMDEIREALHGELQSNLEVEIFVDDEKDGGQRSHYYQRETISTAKELDYYANTQHYRSWIRLGIEDKGVYNGDQNNIVVSFHGIGSQFKGILVCSGTWFRRIPDEDGGRETEGQAVLCDEVFQINYKEEISDIEARFESWLERVIERGLAFWEKTLT